MKGDFTRFTHDPRKHYTRVLRQQGRVDLDADWNEAVEILTGLERIEAVDVIGRCGAPETGGGFRIELGAGGAGLTASPGRLYVDGLLCRLDGTAPVPLTAQEDLPGFTLPTADGNYLVYVDVWERHLTAVEDPEIREVALGGPDTTTRTRTICQIRLERLAETDPLDQLACRPHAALPVTGRLAARAEPETDPGLPCAVPAAAGYRGIENRLYRVEIHDAGRDADGNQVRTPTFVWSRDDGAVVLPIADGGIAANQVTLRTLGRDEVLTVREGDWVEIAGDESELHGHRGTLARIVPNGIDRADLEITLDRDVSHHAGETYLKLRRWDQQATADVALAGGAVPIQADWYELEDGVQVRFDTSGVYHAGDYWLIPARTSEGGILWPTVGEPAEPAELARFGIEHHFCTLALARLENGLWVDRRDCRRLFPPLVDVGRRGCCVVVHPGQDVQQAVDTVLAAGGGCVKLCAGVHEIAGPLRLPRARDLVIRGQGAATVVRFRGRDDEGRGGVLIENGQRVVLEDALLVTDDAPALVTLRHGEPRQLNHGLALRRLVLVNHAAVSAETPLPCGIWLGHTRGVAIEECRIAATVGIASLWGDTLPDPTRTVAGEAAEAPPLVAVGFEELAAGLRINVNDTVVDSGVTLTGRPFAWSNGQETSNGYARVQTNGRAGGSGQELWCNNINLRFDPPAPYRFAQIAFGTYGGNENLEVNGDRRNVGDLFSLDGQTIGGVAVSVTPLPNARNLGRLTLTAVAGGEPIRAFAIGGQEFAIDDLVFRTPEPGESDVPAPIDLAAGVAELSLLDSEIRYAEYGILALKCEAWRLADARIAPFDERRWTVLRRALAAVDKAASDDPTAARRPYAAALAALENVFAATAARRRGTAVLAFLWRDCEVRDCTLTGALAASAWWWIRGTVAGCEIAADDLGLFAFWLHDAAWSDNRVDVAAGLGLAFAGAYSARVSGNRVRAEIGLGNVASATVESGLFALVEGAGRAHAQTGPDDLAAVVWGLLEETVALLGLRALASALQQWWLELGLPGERPLLFLVAELLVRQWQDQDDAAVVTTTLPVIDLEVAGNALDCRRCCLSLDRVVALGAIRVTGNRIHTVTGQAVRLEAHPLLANPHVVVLFVRLMLDRIRASLEASRAEAGSDAPQTPTLDELIRLWRRWQQDIEGFLDVDLRIEGNTVRSLRTAIESNLYALAVAGNTITMQERTDATRRLAGRGVVTGVIADAQGRAVAGARVRVLGSEREAITDAQGAYRIADVPQGAHTVRVSAPGTEPALRRVELAGERAAADVVVARSRQNVLAIASAATVADQRIVRTLARFAAPHAETSQVVQALAESEALAPLADAIREGAHTDPDLYGAYLASAKGPLATAAAREAAAAAVTFVSGATSSADLAATCSALNAALRNNDRTQLASLLPRLVLGLQGYTDSQGILVKGVGCRLVDNHVLVPVDADPATQALGGVQISVGFAHLVVALALGQALLRLVGEDESRLPADPLLGLTQTLVDRNEIVGGAGHGISVQGVAGLPAVLTDLCISDNEVRGLGGAGILSNEYALTVGVEIADNQVTGCGRAAGFTRLKGGIVVTNAALCHLRGNRVERCGAQQETHDVVGVDLDGVYGLNVTDNVVVGNGSDRDSADDGGVQLVEVYGAASLHGNTVSRNRGLGLAWVNSAQPGENALLPAALVAVVNLVQRTQLTAAEITDQEQGSVRGNVLEGGGASGLPVFRLQNLTGLAFSGNTCQGTTGGAPLGEIQRITRGLVTDNLLRPAANTVAISIKKLAAGVVTGNVSEGGGIQIQYPSGGVQHGFNVPPATT